MDLPSNSVLIAWYSLNLTINESQLIHTEVFPCFTFPIRHYNPFGFTYHDLSVSSQQDL